MKLFVSIFFTSFLFSPSLSFGEEICPKALSVGWEKAIPFQFKEKNDIKGIDIDTLKAIMNKLNCRLEFKEIPWERHLKEIEKGEIDLAAGANITPERKTYANFSNPYLTEYIYFYILKSKLNSINFKNEEELIGLKMKMGAVAGAYIGPIFEDALKNKLLIPNKNYYIVKNEKQLVEMLLAKRIEGFVLGEFVNNLNPKIINHPTKMYEHNTNFMFSKKTVSLNFINKFNKALLEIEKEGLLTKIRNQYNNDNSTKY